MKAKKIWFDKDFIYVETTENKTGKMPLKWFKRLENAKKEALKTPLQGIVASLEGMKIRKDREALLHFGTFPILLILGKQDPVLNYEENKNQIEKTKVQLVTFPDGHMSHIENREELTKVLVDFLKKV